MASHEQSTGATDEWYTFAPKADLWLFVSPKLKFVGGQEAADLGLVAKAGDCGKSPAQGTCLWAAGVHGVAALKRASVAGLGVLGKPL